jgi:hypothetical protein
VRTPLQHREKHSEQKKVEKQVKNGFPVFWQFAGSAVQSCTMVLAGLASESRRKLLFCSTRKQGVSYESRNWHNSLYGCSGTSDWF